MRFAYARAADRLDHIDLRLGLELERARAPQLRVPQLHRAVIRLRGRRAGRRRALLRAANDEPVFERRVQREHGPRVRLLHDALELEVAPHVYVAVHRAGVRRLVLHVSRNGHNIPHYMYMYNIASNLFSEIYYNIIICIPPRKRSTTSSACECCRRRSRCSGRAASRANG